LPSLSVFQQPVAEGALSSPLQLKFPSKSSTASLLTFRLRHEAHTKRTSTSLIVFPVRIILSSLVIFLPSFGVAHYEKLLIKE